MDARKTSKFKSMTCGSASFTVRADWPKEGNAQLTFVLLQSDAEAYDLLLIALHVYRELAEDVKLSNFDVHIYGGGGSIRFAQAIMARLLVVQQDLPIGTVHISSAYLCSAGIYYVPYLDDNTFTFGSHARTIDDIKTCNPAFCYSDEQLLLDQNLNQTELAYVLRVRAEHRIPDSTLDLFQREELGHADHVLLGDQTNGDLFLATNFSFPRLNEEFAATFEALENFRFNNTLLSGWNLHLKLLDFLYVLVSNDLLTPSAKDVRWGDGLNKISQLTQEAEVFSLIRGFVNHKMQVSYFMWEKSLTSQQRFLPDANHGDQFFQRLSEYLIDNHVIEPAALSTI
jgi:hypothetical protein